MYFAVWGCTGCSGVTAGGTTAGGVTVGGVGCGSGVVGGVTLSGGIEGMDGVSEEIGGSWEAELSVDALKSSS
jgi:hypothetical protein